jgi:hypothetical protein
LCLPFNTGKREREKHKSHVKSNKNNSFPFLFFFSFWGSKWKSCLEVCYCPECVCVRVDALPRVARTHKRRPIVKNDVKREKTGAKNRPSGVIITPSPVTSRWTMRLCVNLILGDVSVTGRKKEPPSLNFQPATGGPPLSCRLGLQHVETAQLSL